MNTLTKKPLLVCILIIGITVLISFASTTLQEWDSTYDDVFIFYRYAKNLASGFGLIWNKGVMPTEGFTNILLIVVLVPFIKLGMDPLLITGVLSYISVLIIFGILYLSARRHFGYSPAISMIISLLIFFVPETKHLCNLGLETVIYACFLLVAFVAGIVFLHTHKIVDFILFWN